MKRFVVIGLGNFGASLVETLHEHGHEVIVVAADEDAVDAIAPHASVAIVGDGRSVETLRRVGAAEADCGIINTGRNPHAVELRQTPFRCDDKRHAERF